MWEGLGGKKGMIRYRNWKRWRGVMMAGILILGACAGDDNSASSDELPVIRISGLSGGPSSIALKALEENGLDEKYGFEGDFTTRDADAANQFFFQGESDVAFDIDPAGVAIARVSGINISGIGSVVNNHICLMVRDDAPFDAPADLAGRKVGHYGTDSGGTVTLAILMQEFHDIDIFSDWQLIESDPNGLVELLHRGDIDAAVVFEPNISKATLDEGSKCLVPYFTDVWSEATGGNLFLSMITAHDDWIEEDPELAQAVTDAWDEGQQWLSENPEALTESPYKELTGIDDPEVLERFSEVVNEIPLFTSSWTEDDLEGIEAFIDLAAAQGTLFDENPGGVTRMLE